MNANTRTRVLIHCRGAGTDIFKTLVSLSCQSTGAHHLTVVLASTSPEEHCSKEAALLHSALGFHSLSVLDARGMHPVMALNVAALEGDEECLALVPEGSRLGPRFLARCLEPLGADRTMATFCTHTAGAPGCVPLTRIQPFRANQLVRLNPVGPAALVRRQAWEELGGLRPGMQLVMWDFWLRLALSGGGITRVPELLAVCRPLQHLPPAQDGQAKALLVVGSPGAFEPDVCRWALARLRGDSWATSFEPGQIPGPRDVRAMFAGLPPSLRPRTPGWSEQHICTA